MQSFTPSQKKKLLTNPNVLKITENHLVFKPEFKIKAVDHFMRGMTADEIFIAHGFDLSFFEKDYFKYALKKWKLKLEISGEDSFYTESRGREASGRHRKNLDDLTMDDLKALVYIQGELLDEIKKKKALAKKLSSK